MNTRATLIALFVVALGVIVFAVVRTRTAPTPEPVGNPPAGGLSQVYSNSALGFSIGLPSGYTVDEAYSYQELGPGKDIPGVKFTIATSTVAGSTSSLQAGTNLGSDTYISVEKISQSNPPAGGCTAGLFLDQHGGTSAAEVLTDGGTTYSVASSTGAAAGNRYEETVYTLPGTSPCIAMRYFIHYGVIDNYPTGTVSEFDKQALLAQFDAIRRTLVVIGQ